MNRETFDVYIEDILYFHEQYNRHILPERREYADRRLNGYIEDLWQKIDKVQKEFTRLEND